MTLEKDAAVAHTHAPHGKTVPLAIAAIGIVFGDIGTSPLYAFRETLAVTGTDREAVFGSVSLIFWALVIVVLVKYLTLVMRADNQGEGGILALLALLPERYRKANRGVASLLLLLILIGTALLFGDGALTPAISVLSAMEGVGVINENIAHFAVPLTVVILLGLFMVQPRGTHRIGRIFGPVMLGWFLMIAVLGLYNVALEPQVIGALSPLHAIGFLSSHTGIALAIGAVAILAVTGGEALYADMGHFGIKPIRYAWIAVVMPSLVLGYLGQAAVVVRDPEKAETAFFALAPNTSLQAGMVVMATLATVIASQALITGAFSLARQAVQLGLFPRVDVRHTSDEHEGQIYVPVVNWLLGIASISLVISFGSSSALASAYVLAIAGTMTVTTVAFYFVTREVWHWPAAKAVPILVLLLVVDLYFLVSASGTFLRGGWVPVAMGAVILGIMLLWRHGNRLLSEHSLRTAMTWEEISEILSRGGIPRSEGEAVMLYSNEKRAPHALSSTIRLVKALPANITLLTVKTGMVPFVEEADRLEVEDLPGGLRKVRLNVGFAESPNVPEMLAPLGGDAGKRTYFLSDRNFSATDAGAMGHVSESLFAFLYRNAARPAHYLGLPQDQVVTVSTFVDL